MAQIGKLYNYYLGKIFRKNWGRIIIFTLLIGVVWWFGIPYLTISDLKEKGKSEGFSEESLEKTNFRSVVEFLTFQGAAIGHELNRQKFAENVEKLRKGVSDKEWKTLKWELFVNRSLDSFNIVMLSYPFTADNVFFFNQKQEYSEGTEFWKLLNDISWWNLSSFFVLFWFIFTVLDKTFFSPRQDGEEITVLTLTPGVKRSDLVWSRILAFLTFYFVVNVLIFLIPFGVYYWWVAPQKSFSWFALLGLYTTIVGPILFFGLIFTPYLFLGSWSSGTKWIMSSLVSFLPALWGGIKFVISTPLPYTIEEKFFNPIWFTTISLVVGIIFLFLYYYRYQEEDLG